MSTNRNINIQQAKLATVSQRFQAFFLDFLIIIGVSILLYFLYISAMGNKLQDALIAFHHIFLSLFFVYDLICNLSKSGSVGKQSTEIKVYSSDGDSAHFIQSLCRSLLKIWTFLMPIMLFMVDFNSIPLVFAIILWAVFLIYNFIEHKRTLPHDLVTKTRVLKKP